MSSEIDPMVQELIDATRNDAQAGGADNDEWRDETAQRLTARLAAANDLIQPLHESVMDAIGGIVRLDDSADEERLSDAVLDAVMAVIAPDTAGGE